MRKAFAGLLLLATLLATACASKPEPTFALNTPFILGDWEMEVYGYETTDLIESGIGYFQPDPGNLFVIVDVSGTNTGKDSAYFISTAVYSPKYVMAALDYNEEANLAVNLIGYKEGISGGEVEPGETRRGMLAFEVPAELANEPLKLGFYLDQSYIYCMLPAAV